jgi:RNA polymerase sigma factor (sigma-70 family)
MDNKASIERSNTPEIAAATYSASQESEFQTFYEKTYRQLVRYANVLRPGSGEDLAQSALAKIWEHRSAYCEADLRPVVFRTARNLAIDLARRDRIVTQEPFDFGDEYSHRLVNDNSQVEASCEAIWRFVTAMEMNEVRRVVELRWFHEYNELEICRALGIGRRRVRTILAWARREAVAVGFGAKAA